MKIVEMDGVVGLMAHPCVDWDEAVRQLVREALVKGIVPACITFSNTEVEEGPGLQWEICLYGGC